MSLTVPALLCLWQTLLKRVHWGHWDLEWWWCRLRRPALNRWNSSIRLRSQSFSGLLLFFSLFSQMDLHVATAFIGSCKSSTTCVTGKWLFSSMSTDVSCQMVWAGKVPHAYTALEWFLSSVGSHVAGQFIRPWEPPWTSVHWASVRPLTWWCSWATISGVVTFSFQQRVTSFCRATSLNRLAWHCKKISWWCCMQEQFVHHCSMIRRHGSGKWRRATKDWPLHIQCSCSLHKHWRCGAHWLLHGSLVKVGLCW